MPELEWLELARTDLLAIVDYISDDNSDAAQRLKDDIEAKAANLPEFHRDHRPGRLEGTRKMIVWANTSGDPPYVPASPAGATSVSLGSVEHEPRQSPH